MTGEPIEVSTNIPKGAKPASKPIIKPSGSSTGTSKKRNPKTGKLFYFLDEELLRLFQRLASEEDYTFTQMKSGAYILEKDGEEIGSIHASHISFPNPGGALSDEMKERLKFIVDMVIEAVNSKSGTPKEVWVEGSEEVTKYMKELYEKADFKIIDKPSAEKNDGPDDEPSPTKLTF